MALIINRLNNILAHKSELNVVWRQLTVRNFSNSKPRISHEHSSPDSFTKVYELPKIKILRLVSRFKLYHTALTALVVPLSVNISTNAGLSAATLSFVGCLIFYGSSHFLNNLVGAVYVNKSIDTVMLSYINFWGKRMDKICPVDDVVSLCNQPLQNNIFKLSKIQFSSSPQSLLLASENGIIFHPYAFDKIFFGVVSDVQKQTTHPLPSLSKGTVKSQ